MAPEWIPEYAPDAELLRVTEHWQAPAKELVAGAYTRPLFSSTSAVSVTEYTLVPGLYSALDVVLRTRCITVGIW